MPYVSRAYKSAADNQYKITIAVPLLSPSCNQDATQLPRPKLDEAIGFLCETMEIGTGGQGGYLDFLGRIDGMIIGPEDGGELNGGPDQTLHDRDPENFLIVFHPNLRDGERFPVEAPLKKKLRSCRVRDNVEQQLEFASGSDCESLDDFFDPVANKFWTYAAIHPIGRTGYFAVGMVDP